MNQYIKSALHTFIATFLTTFVAAILAIPSDTFFSASTWGYSAIAAIVVSAVRAGVKSLIPLE